MKQLLTHSRQDAFKTCRKKHWFSYELGLRSEVDAKALRMGSAYHEGLELLGTVGLDSAADAIYAYYEQCPDKIELRDWEIERETVVRLLYAYHWYWDTRLEVISAEEQFRVPLINPETGRSSQTFDLAGKIDGICRVEDGRLVVRECKLLGEDLSDESDLWRRLQVDHQISLYVLAARQKGYDIHSVLYDVTRKPTIKPTMVPVLDKLGAKIVLDANGERPMTKNGQFYQRGNKDKGLVLQEREMTAEEWGEKLTNDICERPQFYFARKEIPRLDQDLEEYRRELWEIGKAIRDAQLKDAHYRTCNKNTCSWCNYFGLCTSGHDPDGPTPEGFVKLDYLHPELEDLNHALSSTPETTAST